MPGTDRVLNHIHWPDDPDPLRWQPLPTQFDVAAAAGVTARVVSQPESRRQRADHGRLPGRASTSPAARADALADAMLAGLRGPAPALVYGYQPDVDKAGHLFGVGSPEWTAAVA